MLSVSFSQQKKALIISSMNGIKMRRMPHLMLILTLLQTILCFWVRPLRNAGRERISWLFVSLILIKIHLGFKPSDRQWNFSEDGNTAWFDESLETWMQGCRGTGILSKKEGRWFLSYYNLHVLIENDKIQEFISLEKKP